VITDTIVSRNTPSPQARRYRVGHADRTATVSLRLCRLTSPPAGSSVGDVACSVVCVSHTTGSGGDEVGKLVAEQLGYLCVDEDIVARAAAQGDLEARDVADEERRKSFVRRTLDALAEGGGDALVLGAPLAATMEGLRPADVRALIRDTVVETAARGDVVIVSHAASYALEPSSWALRVFITSSPGTRAQRVGAAEELDEAQATRAIKDSDGGRRDYLKRFYSVDQEAPTDYDLVINTDLLSTEQAAAIVVHAVGR